MAATVAYASTNNLGIRTLSGDAYLTYKQSGKLNVSGELTLDAELNGDDKIGLWGHVTDKTSDDPEPLARFSSGVHVVGQGLASHLDLAVNKKNRVVMAQNATWGQAEDSVYYSSGEMSLILNEDIVVNATFSASLDTKFGADDSLSASVLLLESAQYGGELVAAAAKVVSAKKSSDGFKTFTGEASFNFKQEPKVDTSAVVTIDTESDTMGLYGTVTNNLANTDGQQLAKLAASLTKLFQGFSSEVDLIVYDTQKV
jgi:hypothetical protein